MPRNYILKLEEVEFTNSVDWIYADITGYFPDSLPDFTGSTLEVGGEKFLYAGGFGTSYGFMRDGSMPESAPEEYVSIDVVEEGGVSLNFKANKYPSSGAPYTLPVYLYTGEDEDPSSHNFSFSDHSRNDVDGIDNLMDALLGNEEA